ncbi:PD-(D/E)XK nuclease family protein [candidate division WS5 bacterium]|uniref:DNA 3'-5' helicase n=1 Tax=candidate division WS5 bacterium TaxID=2093353 RepID=A0A419DAU1_9BACT|nr:MAG: PD-(D/E)XK nuclease family protein [candidate division WS5 bacterium]
MEDLLKGLNKEQRDAVTHTSGPLLIIAGAGTGKTTVITRRIAYLIATKKALPSEILALTFTDKAAAEMEERVDELVPYGFVDTWISTFHAFGDRILRDHALDLGLTTDFRVLSKPEQTIFMQDNLSAFDLKHFSPLGNPMKHIDALLGHFSKLKDELITPAEYLEYADFLLSSRAQAEGSLKNSEGKGFLRSPLRGVGRNDNAIEAEKTLEIARAFERYQELMAEAGNLDFGDQINMVIKLFKGSPKVLEKYRRQFKYILVDEFQDTNYAQNELLKLLASKNGNITVVGDDDQSIYRFRGAAISNILSFAKDYPKCKQIVLTENYRSTQSILDSAYKMIKHNDPDRLEVKNNIIKKLRSKVTVDRVAPIHIHCDTVTSEADKVAKTIKEKYEAGEYSLKDFAILARSRNSAQPFIHALDHAGIPYKFSGSAGLYDRPEVRLLIHFARALTNPGDNLAFYHLLISDVYNMPVEDAVKLNEISHKNKRSLNHIAKAEKMEVSEKSQGILDRVCTDMEGFREESRDMTAGQILYSFLKETGYLTRLVAEAEKSAEAQVAIQNIAKFFESVGNFEKVSEDKSVVNFVRHLGALMDAGDDPATAEVDPDLEAVSILTVHKSKGLEFPVVFLVSLVSDSFPTRKRAEQLPIPEELIKEGLPEGEWHTQEERRLFYVGMTRAKEILYLTSAEDYGGKRTRKVSPFVLEAIDAPSLAKEKTKLDKLEVIKRFEKNHKVEMPRKFYDGKSTLILNAHQIDDYLSCPKKFEYIHVLRVPIMAHHSVVYGSAMHKAIEHYYVQKKAGKNITADDIIEVFHSTWWSEGFITREHEDKRRKQGEKSLREFFSREEAAKNLPDEVEAKFEVKLNLRPEDDQPLADGVKIRGRFDAVFNSSSVIPTEAEESLSPRHSASSSVIPAQAGISPHIEIRDFKTSEVESQEQADKKAKSNRQLSVYALAKQTETGVIPEVSLYFVDSGYIGKVEKKEKDLDKTREEIAKVAEGIKTENFAAAPGYQECSRCAYREICPHTSK